jgi:hypothetical protein
MADVNLELQPGNHKGFVRLARLAQKLSGN